ncbi:tRNA lysidine(34) synthetase TilS [Rhodovulum sp. YNF3179]|uniref:tRNA lysidine(34) synthetase TilS n=1 Tax=Rhodovulum sp. YNF3179 TaxID=3425127 RepID=UPI003D33EF0C
MAACLGGPAPGRLGVAVSGGGDSVALMALLADWAGPRGVALSAVTVDHGLRPEAAEEAALAARSAARLGLPHETLRWQGWDGQGNLQDAARRARRALIADWAGTQGLGAVALGHTLDDQAETVLLRLARGSGVDGLSGMARHRRAAGIVWLRPLLGVRRAALRALLRDRDLPWAEDPSNADPRFDRVKARRALEALAPLGLDAEGLAETAGHMATARAALEAETQDAARAIARVTVAGAVCIDRAGLVALPEEIRLRLVSHALIWVASAGYRPRRRALERALSDAVAGQAGTLHGCELRPEAGDLCIRREPAAVRDMTARPGEIWDGRWRVTGPGAPDLRVAALGIAGLADCPGWRETGLSRGALAATPAVWRDARLVAAPLAGRAEGWQARLEPGADSFFETILSH